MKQSKFILLILLSFILSNCGTTFKITKTIDTIDPNISVYKTSKIQVKGNSTEDRYETYLSFIASVNKGKATYYFNFIYRGQKWAGLSKLKLNIEGVKSTYLITKQPIQSANNLIGLTEQLSFEIPTDKIEELIENRKCKVTIVGSELDAKFDFKQEWFDKLTKFFIEVNKR